MLYTICVILLPGLLFPWNAAAQINLQAEKINLKIDTIEKLPLKKDSITLLSDKK